MRTMKLNDIFNAILACAMWGGNFAIMKFAMLQIPPLFLAGMRLWIIGFFCLWFVKVPWGHFWKLFLISITLYSLNFGLMVSGLVQIDSGLASILTELEVPFSAALAAIFLKDRMTPIQILGLLIAFFGAYFVCNTPNISGSIIPILLVVGATLTYAFSNVQIKYLSEVNALTIIVYASLLASPQLLIASVLLETNQINSLMTISFQTGIALLYTLSMATLAFIIWTRLIKIYSVNQVVPFGLLIPLFGVMGGVFLLDEEITPKIIIGGWITILGVWLVLRKTRITEKKSELSFT